MADGPGQRGVAAGTVGQDQQVVAAWVGQVEVGVGRDVLLALGLPFGTHLRGSVVSVSSAPNTVGSPTARAASAKRTTP